MGFLWQKKNIQRKNNETKKVTRASKKIYIPAVEMDQIETLIRC